MDRSDIILIVDDVPNNLSVLMDILESIGYSVLVATDGRSAIEQAEYASPGIILLDVMMPGMDGFETCRQLKARKTTCDIPIIFVTALSETTDKVLGFELGAVDFITKPLQQEEVVARVNTHLTLYHQRQEIARQNAEIERLREQDRLRFEKLSQLKDSMLNTASHNLRNPLSVIISSLSLLRYYMSPEDRRIHEKLDHIQSAADEMRHLISDMLDLARIETGGGLQKAAVSLRHLVETNIKLMITVATEKRITLQLRPSLEDITLQCDVFQIGQVLQNLISNALKYTPENGSIEISTALLENRAVVHITDTGIGIPEKDIPHVFEKFYRVDTQKHREVTGTGLGLSIVLEIIQQHGGTIEVKSTPDAGTTFTFSLPAEA